MLDKYNYYIGSKCDLVSTKRVRDSKHRKIPFLNTLGQYVVTQVTHVRQYVHGQRKRTIEYVQHLISNSKAS